ncbi:MAG: molybdopterin-dependent oxidoreductase [Rhizobiales bacterium]|nr:molybdopterin-dependent oxidoreductase [Hyphomicrobiales bacterium]
MIGPGGAGTDVGGSAGGSAAGDGRRTVRNACPHDCPDTCAMLTHVEQDRIIGVAGDPEHPFTRGSLCAKVRNYERRVHHPGRILHPLRRVGAKGEGRFARITWNEALVEIAERLGAIAARRGSEAILPCSYLGQQGLVNGLHCGDPFFNALGASIAERTFCNSGAGLAHNMVLGPTAGLDAESFAHARHIVLWGCNIVATGPHHWHFISEARRRGAKLTVIDPRLSRTARKADTHVQPLPGTDCALALGVIHVLFRDGLVDEEFTRRSAIGIDELAERARDWPPEVAGRVTGLAAGEIVALAQALAAAQPLAMRLGVALERQENGGDAVRAICAISVLTGSWREVGGGIMQSAGRAFPINRAALTRADLIRPGTRVLNLFELGPLLTGERSLEPPIEALVVYNCNPLSACGEQNKVLAGLARSDLFLIVSEQFMTETAEHADIVLPATTQLEQFDIMYSWGHFHLMANLPAIEPLGEAVSNAELFRRLAEATGLAKAHPSLLRSDLEIAREALDWTHPALAGITLEALLDKGSARLAVGAAETRLPHADGRFPTPSGKAEFASSLAARGAFVMAHFRQGYEGGQDGTPVDPLPCHVEAGGAKRRDAERHPFHLISSKSHRFLNSCYGDGEATASSAEPLEISINEADAQALGIADGSMVVVSNALGELIAVARVGRLVRPGVVAMVHGHWRKRTTSGGTVSALVRASTARTGKSPAVSDTRVSIRPLAESEGGAGIAAS